MSTETQPLERLPTEPAWWTVARYEGRNRVPVTTAIAVVVAVYATLFLWLGSFYVADPAIQDLLDAFPPVLNELFGFASLASLEGLFASEFYTFGWVVGLGGYLTYSAASTVAGDLESGRMDQLLAGPVPRSSVLVGKFFALLVPTTVLNVVTPMVLYGGSMLVGEPLTLWPLLMVHALSVPYLLFWGAVGVVLGVVVRAGRRAGRIGLGLVFFAWILDSILTTTAYASLAVASPSHYFDPPAILVNGTYDIAGAAILGSVTVGLLALAIRRFERTDL